jgi:hypothetical protein
VRVVTTLLGIALGVALLVGVLVLFAFIMCDAFGLCPWCGCIEDAQAHEPGCRKGCH